jgi:hypothetical protein
MAIEAGAAHNCFPLAGHIEIGGAQQAVRQGRFERHDGLMVG